MTATTTPANGRWDIQSRFIRIVAEHGNGLVEFEFAVGEPQLFVEMVMQRAEFDDFCRMQGVQPTHGRLPEPEPESAKAEWDWSLRDARERHFRDES